MKINVFSLHLGSSIGVKCAVIVGGMDMVAQSLMLAKKPHIIIATPGRLVDHLENTKGFSLRNLKMLVSRCINSQNVIQYIATPRCFRFFNYRTL